MQNVSVRVSICVATCKRPDSLARLLAGIDRLQVEPSQANVLVVVVDNDASASSRAAVEGWAVASPWPHLYLVETRRGIPFARNAAVSACLDRSDAIAFVDDDEVPHPQWLTHLLATRKTYGADVVTGPALPRFEQRPPVWALNGPFFALPRYGTGTLCDRAFTNNVLVNNGVFRQMEGWFDQRLRFTGGSDTHFFRRAHLAGFRLVWCDEAVVDDYIPPSRVSRRWVVQRAYRYGHTHAFVRRDLGQDTPARLAITAVLRMRYAASSAVVGLARGQQWRLIEGMTVAAYTAGMLANLAGAKYQEYRAHT